ncbi:MAG: hypothetical protein WCV85_04985 [Patescibacteria group bacterium]|jgi:hypothetical protein
MYGLFLILIAGTAFTVYFETCSRLKRVVEITCYVNAAFLVLFTLLPLLVVIPAETGELLIEKDGKTTIVKSTSILWVPSYTGIYYEPHITRVEDGDITVTFSPKPGAALRLRETYRSSEEYYTACELSTLKRLRDARLLTTDSSSAACVFCAFANLSWNTNEELVRNSDIVVTFKTTLK